MRILARFGRTGPVLRVTGPDHFDINDLLTRDSGKLPQIQNLHKKLGHMSYESVLVSTCRAGPVQGSGIPDLSDGPKFRTGP